MAITVRSTQAKPHGDPLPRGGDGKGALFARLFRPRVKSSELIYFTSQLSLMLEVGTPLTVAVGALRRQTENPAFAAILSRIGQDVESGSPLSSALARFPEIFDNVFTSLVKAGESGGVLQETLDRLVEMQEKRQALRTQLRTALAYPAVLCVLAFAVIIFILVAVLPKFTAFFEGKESLLPPTTRFLMASSASMRGYWPLYVVGALGFVIGVRLWKDSRPGKAFIDYCAVSLPFVSRLNNKICTCRLLRTLGHLLESRVPLLECLDVTRETMRNQYYQRLLDQIRDQVQQGARLSRAFQDYPYTLPSVRQMVATGEETGNLYEVMLRLAQFYDKEVDQELKTFAALIEPLALIVLGTIVGVLVSSIILPLFKLAQALG